MMAPSLVALGSMPSGEEVAGFGLPVSGAETRQSAEK
jgi:hypothetical protein